MFLCCHYTTGYFPAQEKVSNGKQKVSIRKPRFFVEIEQPVFSAASACLPSWYRWPEGPEGVAFHSGDTLSVTAFAVTAPPKGGAKKRHPLSLRQLPQRGSQEKWAAVPPSGGAVPLAVFRLHKSSNRENNVCKGGVLLVYL